jgi:hypothetical protein
MDEVLLFVEHDPSHDDVLQVLRRLDEAPPHPVTAMVHVRVDRATALSDEVAGGRGLAARSMVGELRAEHDWEVERRRHVLTHVVGILRAAGHRAHGELLAGPLPRVLVREVLDRTPALVVLVTDRHRLAHRLHRDLERRLRHLHAGPVVALVPGRVAADV